MCNGAADRNKDLTELAVTLRGAADASLNF